jgi:hypothetical protein
MNERKLLSAVVRETNMDLKHAAADMLLDRLVAGALGRDTLDLLDGMLKKDLWVSQKDDQIRDKLQAIGTLVDLEIIRKPRQYEIRPKWNRRFNKTPDHFTGRWMRQAAGQLH